MATTNNINTQLTTNNTSKNNTQNSVKIDKKSFETYASKINVNKKTYTYSDIFTAASKKYNVPQTLLEAVAFTESSFNKDATSYCGAMGLMQLMPTTAKSLGVNDAYDPVQNVMGGAKYLSQMLKKYNGDTTLALAAYNGGPGNVAKHGGVPSFCEAYVNKVENLIKKGVRVPNKTITIDINSNTGQIMSKYTDTTSKLGQDSTNSKISQTNDKTIQDNNTNTKFNVSKKALVSYDTNTQKNDSSNSINYEDLFNYAAKEYNVPSEILKAIAYTQSSFNSNAISKSGAIGLMQLMPSTAKELGVTNAYDPVQNVMAGAKYLSNLLKRYNNNITYAIAAYSAGMGNVDSYNGIPPFAQNFVNKVISLSKKGLTAPNITLETSLFSKNSNSNSQNHNNKEETNKKALIDFQI